MKGTTNGTNDQELLEAYARAEDIQQQLTPDMPFSEMLEPAYRRMADELDLPNTDEIATSLRASIPKWPAGVPGFGRRVGTARRESSACCVDQRRKMGS